MVTSEFESLARIAARAQGYDNLRMFVLPHPMESRPRAEILTIIRSRFDELMALLARGA